MVVARLQTIDASIAYSMYPTMLLGDAARPATGQHILQRFRFSDTSEGIAQHVLD